MLMLSLTLVGMLNLPTVTSSSTNTTAQLDNILAQKEFVGKTLSTIVTNDSSRWKEAPRQYHQLL